MKCNLKIEFVHEILFLNNGYLNAINLLSCFWISAQAPLISNEGMKSTLSYRCFAM